MRISQQKETTLISGSDGSTRSHSFDNGWLNIFERETEKKRQSDNLSSRDEHWIFNVTAEWGRFAYLDGNKTRIIVGLNGEAARSLPRLNEIAEKHQAIIANTISMRGVVKAVVVELPLTKVAAFMEETRAMELASYIEPNMKVQTQLVTNDPYWVWQWDPAR